MDERERELLDAMVNRVLRHPDEVKDIDAQRAVQRLVAARADAYSRSRWPGRTPR